MLESIINSIDNRVHSEDYTCVCGRGGVILLVTAGQEWDTDDGDVSRDCPERTGVQRKLEKAPAFYWLIAVRQIVSSTRFPGRF